MQRNRFRAFFQSRTTGQPKLTWGTVVDHMVTLQKKPLRADTEVYQFRDAVAGYQQELVGDEDSFSVAKISRLAKYFRSDVRKYTAALEEILDSMEQSNIAMSTALEEDGREQVASSEVARLPGSQSDLRSCTASATGGGGAASSGDTEAAGSAAGGDGQVSEEPAGHGGDDQEGSSTTTVTQNRSATSASIPTLHSATSGDEADCEPDPTTPAASMTTDSSNGNGNSNENGNDISNGRVSMQSTAAQTDESWNAWDCLGLDSTDHFSLRAVLSLLREEHYLLHLLLQHHVERMESLRLPRLHMTSQMDPSAASRVLRLQLQQVVRTAEWELYWASHSLSVRGLSVDLLTHCVLSNQPVPPRRRLPAPRRKYSHLLAQLAAANPPVPPPAQPPALNTTYQQLLSEAQAVEDAPARPPTMQAAMKRAIHLMFDQSRWLFYE